MSRAITPKITPSTPRSAISHQLRARAAPSLSRRTADTVERRNRPFSVVVVMVHSWHSREVEWELTNREKRDSNLCRGASGALMTVNYPGCFAARARGSADIICDHLQHQQPRLLILIKQPLA